MPRVNVAISLSDAQYARLSRYVKQLNADAKAKGEQHHCTVKSYVAVHADSGVAEIFEMLDDYGFETGEDEEE